MSRITSTLDTLKARGEKALVTFITAGDPDLTTSEQLVHSLVEAGADLIELGFPFSDPMADGPTIQLSSERALAAGTTLRGVLDLVGRVRQHSNVPIVLMGYYNPVFTYGPAQFARDAAAAGVDGLLLVDLPPEEAEELHPLLTDAGVDLITLLAPTTGAERTAQLAAASEGFLYYVSMTGVTGSQQVDASAITSAVADIKQMSPVPVAVGFGVSTPEDAKSVAAIADAVVVGSALVKLIAEFSGTPRLQSEVQGLVRQLKAAIWEADVVRGGNSTGWLSWCELGKDKHPVFAAGYLLMRGQASIRYSGDITTRESLRTLGKSAAALAAAFFETSFPGWLKPLAHQTGRLTPGILIKELDKLDKSEVPVKIFHMKPQYLE
jgi:tryptophan synthase alpha chain